MATEKNRIQASYEIINSLQELMNENENIKQMVLENPADYFHVIMNIVPTMVYNSLTKSDEATLDVNYIANRLCFQFGKLED